MIRRRLLAKGKEAGRASEDVIAASRLAERYAVSDGASTSYAGRAWAKTLCRQYIRDPDLRSDWLEIARTRFLAEATPTGEGWSATMAFERGSFATLLGISLKPDRITIQAIGDTVLFISGNTEPVQMIPELSAEEFLHSPELLCSHAGTGTFADTDAAFEASRYEVFAPETGWYGTRLVVVTDALAHWIVSTGNSTDQVERLNFLGSLENRAAFFSFIENETLNNHLKYDDYTLVILDL